MDSNESLGFASAPASTNMLSDGDASSAAGARTPTIEYRTIDKSTWGDGPWQSEPDKRQWADEATGLPCLIVRGPVGALCGYVGVRPGHPLHGKGYDYAHDAADLDAHGGLTFADGCQHGSDPSRGVCHIPGPGEPDAVWWFGFDCAHAGDVAPSSHYDRARAGEPTGWGGTYTYRALAYVEDQVRALAAQLAAHDLSTGAVTGGLQARSPNGASDQ